VDERVAAGRVEAGLLERDEFGEVLRGPGIEVVGGEDRPAAEPGKRGLGRRERCPAEGDGSRDDAVERVLRPGVARVGAVDVLEREHHPPVTVDRAEEPRRGNGFRQRRVDADLVAVGGHLVRPPPGVDRLDEHPPAAGEGEPRREPGREAARAGGGVDHRTADQRRDVRAERGRKRVP
jgi:hypothetical protein